MPSILVKRLNSAEVTYLEMLESAQQSCKIVGLTESTGCRCSTQTNIVSNDLIGTVSTRVKVVCTSFQS